MRLNFDLKKEFIKSAKWSAISDILVYGSNGIRVVILATILSPDDFGISAILLACLVIPTVLNQLGFAQAIISMQRITPQLVNTLCIFIFGLWLLLFLIICAISPTLADLFSISIMPIALPLLSFGVLFSSIEALYVALIQRNLDYKSQGKLRVIRDLSLTAISLPMAFLGCGVWALIIPWLVTTLLTMCASQLISKHITKIFFSKTLLLQAIKFGKFATIGDLANMICNKGVPLVMGSIWTPSMIGQYAMADRINNMTFQVITSQYTNSIFPIISKLRDDSERLKELAINFISLQSIFLAPLAMIALIGTPFILTSVLGDKWIVASQIFQIMILSQIFRLASPPSNAFLYALNRPDISSRIAIARACLYSLIFGACFYFNCDPIIFIAMIVMVDVVIIYAYMIATFNLIGINFSLYIISITKMLKVGTPVVLSMLFSKYISYNFNYSENITEIFSIIIGVLMYLIAIYFQFKDHAKKIYKGFK